MVYSSHLINITNFYIILDHRQIPLVHLNQVLEKLSSPHAEEEYGEEVSDNVETRSEDGLIFSGANLVFSSSCYVISCCEDGMCQNVRPLKKVVFQNSPVSETSGQLQASL